MTESVNFVSKTYKCIFDLTLPVLVSSQIFRRNQHLYTVEQNDAEELVARAARKIEQLLRKRSAALEVRLIPLRRAESQKTTLLYLLPKDFFGFVCVYGICVMAFKILRLRSTKHSRMNKGEYFINSAQTCATSA